MKITGSFTIHVNPSVVPPLVLTPPSGPLPDETVGQDVTGEIDISGGTPPYTLTPITGLPPGVSASFAGTKIMLFGVPSLAGDSSFNVEVTDSGQ